MSMRTTLTLEDDVLRLAKQRAGELDRPLKDIINDALRLGLTIGRDRREPYTFRLHTVKGRVLPAVDLTDRDKLFDVMEGQES